MKNYLDKLKLINLVICYLFTCYLPTMITFFNIEPIYLCQETIFINTYKLCEIEQICSNHTIIKDGNSYYSFKTSWYKFSNKIDCASIYSIEYFYSAYFIGVFIGRFLFNSLNKIWIKTLVIFISASYNIYYQLKSVILDININDNFLLYTISSGIGFYFLSLSIYEKIAMKNINVNYLSCIGSFIHIIIYDYNKSWKYNSMISIISLKINILIYMTTIIVDKNNEKNLLLIKKPIYNVSNVNNILKKLKLKIKYFDSFMVFILSLTYHSINGFIHKYSYNKFKEYGNLFLIGYIIYLSEILFIFIYDRYEVKLKILFDISLYSPVCIGIFFTFSIIGKNYFFILIISIFIVKFLVCVLYNFLIKDISKNYLERIKIMSLVNYLSVLGAIFSPLVMNNFKNYFLIFSVLYYICFVLKFRLISF